MTEKVNGGSPIGPGFVVYERGPGQPGYDLELAKASVGKGWHKLLEEWFKYIAANPEKNIVVIQVKEKYGELRMYFSGGDVYDLGLADGLELASSTVCEACGQPGELRNRTWILTLCDVCNEEPRPLA